MYIKTNKPEVAKQLSEMGFSYITEIINKQTFYCFQQTQELAQIILNKFADARFIADDHLRF